MGRLANQVAVVAKHPYVGERPPLGVVRTSLQDKRDHKYGYQDNRINNSRQSLDLFYHRLLFTAEHSGVYNRMDQACKDH